MARPAIAWSFSALNTFKNCPRKFWATKIAKVVSDVNQYNVQGDQEHSYFENYLKKGIMLPETIRHHQPLLDKLAALVGEKYYEFKLTLDNQMVPCKWGDFDKAWVRGAADFLCVNGSKAYHFDWKSGKFRPSDEQLELTALLVFRHFPEVQQVNGALVFYKHAKLHPHIVRRSDESRLWNGLISDVKVLEEAKRTDSWEATPNPLCGWCPYKACPHNTNKNLP